ncbi:LiaI-LiaF-like domain-containing protein [Paramaledivibacter caminithermalis]|uniref:N-terminal domain of toast_rack, DUF2154 n=1 Tax=Paramaledivibacter caminithermalis (strain DSM 15212 / CIP 107654 / DViRD3) TaxID=1121301 RepID=A0A1M6LDY6_PARC5|nr:DUF5668 domain-containing protein [Paramaledivibacter caminithermalis]SHJ69352.1 N-terminal domain of toast_rack, DUF2154 [Paramaledivibacter caminithermalis DSM 15212]
MKSRGNLGGFILIFIGVFLLMSNLGIINWSFYGIFRLWPLILIVIGINIIFRANNLIRYITWGIFFIIVILLGFYGDYKWKNDITFNSNPNFVQATHEKTSIGKLRLKLAGGNIKINSINDNLIKAKVSSSNVKRQVRFSDDKTKVDINIEQEIDFIKLNNKKSYDYNFNLNNNVLWDIDIDTGAINGTLDFSSLKISKLDMDMGVSNLNLKFGDKQDYTKVDIDGGISNLEITIPENLGVKADFDGGIKNTNISGLGWYKSGDSYISPNYENAEKKLEIDVDTGIGKFDVRVE